MSAWSAWTSPGNVVITMNLAAGNSERSVPITWMPFMSGIRRSIRVTSGCRRLNISIASRPLLRYRRAADPSGSRARLQRLHAAAGDHPRKVCGWTSFPIGFGHDALPPGNCAQQPPHHEHSRSGGRTAVSDSTRHRQLDVGASARPAPDLEGCSQRERTLAHPLQAPVSQTTRLNCLRIHSLAIIGNPERQVAAT